MKTELYVDGELVFTGSEKRWVPELIPASDLSRGDLIRLCELAVVPVNRWHDRDSAGAQISVGKLRHLLLAGCQFWVITEPVDEGDRCVSDDDTIWIRVTYPGFRTFDAGAEHEEDLFYLPTIKRLMERFGHDWY